MTFKAGTFSHFHPRFHRRYFYLPIDILLFFILFFIVRLIIDGQRVYTASKPNYVVSSATPCSSYCFLRFLQQTRCRNFRLLPLSRRVNTRENYLMCSPKGQEIYTRSYNDARRVYKTIYTHTEQHEQVFLVVNNNAILFMQSYRIYIYNIYHRATLIFTYSNLSIQHYPQQLNNATNSRIKRNQSKDRYTYVKRENREHFATRSEPVKQLNGKLI